MLAADQLLCCSEAWAAADNGYMSCVQKAIKTLDNGALDALGRVIRVRFHFVRASVALVLVLYLLRVQRYCRNSDLF